MKNTFKILILLLLACDVLAQTWPSGAIPDPSAGLPPPVYGRISLIASGAMLSDSIWKDQRQQLSIGIGVGKGLGFQFSASAEI